MGAPKIPMFFRTPLCGSSNAGTQTSVAYQLSLAAAAPGLFAQNASGSGPGAILNQDNTLNGPGHPAVKG